jgi:hypothetical protein
MSERQPLLKQVDEALLKQADKVVNSVAFSKIKESLANLEDEKRGIVIHFISLILILIPLLIVGIVYLSNSSLKKELALKEKIYHLAEDVIADRHQIESVAMNLINNSNIDSEIALQSRIKGMLSGTKVDANKITISDFSLNPSFNQSNQITASINIQKFSSSDLTDLLNGMVNREKFKVLNLNLKKNPETAQIEGTIQVIFNAQAMVAMEMME